MSFTNEKIHISVISFFRFSHFLRYIVEGLFPPSLYLDNFIPIPQNTFCIEPRKLPHLRFTADRKRFSTSPSHDMQMIMILPYTRRRSCDPDPYGSCSCCCRNCGIITPSGANHMQHVTHVGSHNRDKT